MELDKQGPNVTILKLHDGARLLFSYTTPVAVIDARGKAFKTSRFYSRTTTAHVNQFLASPETGKAQIVEQGVIDAFAKAAR